MKSLLPTVLLLFLVTVSLAQNNTEDLLAAGINDAQTFTGEYLAPATESVAFGINNGWFNNAKAPHRFALEISIIGNASFVTEDKRSFQMNIADYENIRFPDNSSAQAVATALGHNDPEVTVIATYDDPVFGNQEVELTLPTGIGSKNINLVPTAFLQVAFSPFKGTQLKGRFFPKVNTNEVEVAMYGLGIQQEFTTFIPKVLPIAISGLVAYTHLDGSYDFTDTAIVEGDNQKIETNVNTLLFQLVIGTRLKVINFYGGLGYLSGKSTSDLLGRYVVTNGLLYADEIIDPFSVKQDISGLRGTVGANLKLGFFGLNVDYSIAEFNSASLGLNFSF